MNLYALIYSSIQLYKCKQMDLFGFNVGSAKS